MLCLSDLFFFLLVDRENKLVIDQVPAAAVVGEERWVAETEVMCCREGRKKGTEGRGVKGKLGVGSACRREEKKKAGFGGRDRGLGRRTRRRRKEFFREGRKAREEKGGERGGSVGG